MRGPTPGNCGWPLRHRVTDAQIIRCHRRDGQHRRVGSDGSPRSQWRHSRVQRANEGNAHRFVQPGRTAGEDGRAADQAGTPLLIDFCKGPSRWRRVRLRWQTFRCLHRNDRMSRPAPGAAAALDQVKAAIPVGLQAYLRPAPPEGGAPALDLAAVTAGSRQKMSVAGWNFALLLLAGMTCAADVK